MSAIYLTPKPGGGMSTGGPNMGVTGYGPGSLRSVYDPKTNTTITYKYEPDGPDSQTDPSAWGPLGQGWRTVDSKPGNVGSNNGASVQLPKDPQQELLEKMQAFFDELNKPLDLNDPDVKYVLDQVGTRAGQQATQRGVEGPLALSQINKAETDARSAMSLQKQGMAGNVLGMMQGPTNQMTAQNMATYDMQYKTGLANLNQKYQQDMAQNQMIGGLIGSGIGALGFMVPGVGAALGPAAMAAGGSLGAGIGGMATGGPPNAPAYQPSWKGF